MPFGMPHDRTILLTYNCVMDWYEMGIFSESIDNNPNGIFLWSGMGQSDAKSIKIESHFHVGISKGLNLPTGHWCLAFILWQVRHLSTHAAISFFILNPIRSVTLNHCTIFPLEVLNNDYYGLLSKFSFLIPLYWAYIVGFETWSLHPHVSQGQVILLVWYYAWTFLT